MDESELSLQRLHRIALVCLVAMAATVALSAYIRLAQSGIGCAEWPACVGRVEPATPAAGIAAARLAHRVVASVVLVGAFLILRTAMSLPSAPRRRNLPAAIGLVALALALAALGAVSRGARLPAIAIGNLLGGFAMLALCWRLANPGAYGSRTGLGGWGTAAIALLALQIALGAQLSASHAALACRDLADCVQAASSGDWQALNPWREPAPDASPLRRSAAPVRLAHGLGAVVVDAAVAALGALAWRRGRHAAGSVLVALAALQTALGWTIASGGLSLPLALLHNAIAAAMLVTLVHLRFGRSRQAAAARRGAAAVPRRLN
jgi:cytochrome c oxidase assembly protein subunit 15